ncbi:DnaT-like ssDNA-binding domain-containing protein [Pantoea sp. JZ2]|uniref:DnaT-like ssDNA-binding domain-containing protein n=1 Tax=Pantoea sp. JZ2 TaxID=2654189 RepID=UPI002B475807|nr:DnaT-like ssDNA-binding domain-containing protein [Pantoea sp. JZ2]
MASSWIKVEVITPDKPEIFQIAEILGIDPDAVLGKLVRIWAWADQQTIDGNAGSVTKGVLDRIAFITGFADSLIAVGWLAYVDGKLTLPNFERHNGESSKKRALTNRRVAEHRKKGDKNVTQTALQKALPEEEEEEDIKDKTPYNARTEISKPSTQSVNAIIDNHVPPSSGSLVVGKFTMFEGWQPSSDFTRLSAVWGCRLDHPPTPEEIAGFVSYWQAEGKAFHQTQWEQKLSRNLVTIRAKKATEPESVPHWNSPEGWKEFI